MTENHHSILKLTEQMFLATWIGDFKKFNFVFIINGQGDMHFVQDILFHGKCTSKFV